MVMKYNNPPTTQSTVDGNSTNANAQLKLWAIRNVALTYAARVQMFLPMADVTTIPKNSGKEMKQYLYYPILSDENANSQGLGPDGEATAGNMYGSSRDISVVSGKLPVLTETGGIVNEVSITRTIVQGSISNFGEIMRWTTDSVDFDTDKSLVATRTKEFYIQIAQTQEDMLQIDLFNNLGIVAYPNGATATDEVVAPITYADLNSFAEALDQARVTRQNVLVAGSENISTKTVGGSWFIYIPRDLVATLERQTNYHGEKCWIPTDQYAAGLKAQGSPVALNEVGQIGNFRFIVHPTMLMEQDAGGTDTSAVLPTSYVGNNGVAGDGTAGSGTGLYRSTSGTNLDVFTMLHIGDQAFTLLGFNGQDPRNLPPAITILPGLQSATTFNDAFGKVGSIAQQWWYGFMPQFSERLAGLKTVAFK